MDSPPAVLSVHSELQELPEFDLVTFTVGTGTMTLTLLDTDIGDDLYVRIFVDYQPPTEPPPRATCAAPSTMTATRTTTCDLTGLCQPQDVGPIHQMNIVVFDRPVLDSGKPLYMATTGGMSTDRTYRLSCQSQ